MNRTFPLPTTATCLAALAVAAAAAQAQTPPRSYVASPEVYKVLAQNEQFQVIAVTWKPGQKDALHSHPAAAVYFLDNCTLRSTMADGKSSDSHPVAGKAIVQPALPGHSMENIGPADCRLVMFEPK